MHRLSWDDARGFQLDSLSLVGLQGAQPINFVTQGVQHSAQQSFSNGDVNNGTSSLNDVTFLDLSIIKLVYLIKQFKKTLCN